MIIPRRGLKVYSCRWSSTDTHFGGWSEKVFGCSDKVICSLDGKPCCVQAYKITRVVNELNKLQV